jgi:hypothetical protein
MYACVQVEMSFFLFFFVCADRKVLRDVLFSNFAQFDIEVQQVLKVGWNLLARFRKCCLKAPLQEGWHAVQIPDVTKLTADLRAMKQVHKRPPSVCLSVCLSVAVLLSGHCAGAGFSTFSLLSPSYAARCRPPAGYDTWRERERERDR